MEPGSDCLAQVWFKHDLRTDDHPGLADAAAAAPAAPLVPCYCFDERLYGHLLRTPLGFEGACVALYPVPGRCLLPCFRRTHVTAAQMC